MVENIRAIADKAAKHGVRPVIHPHAGSYMEFEDGRIVADVPPEIAGLCLDTGQAYYAGMDPVAML